MDDTGLKAGQRTDEGMLLEDFTARAPEIMRKAADFADLLEDCDCYQWGDAVFVDDHREMTDILLRIVLSASNIAQNLSRWVDKGQSSQAADPEADAPRPVARPNLKIA